MGDILAEMCTSGFDLLDHMKEGKERDRGGNWGEKLCNYLIPIDVLLILLLASYKANATHFF